MIEGRGPAIVAALRHAHKRGVLTRLCTSILEAHMEGNHAPHSPGDLEALTQAAIDNAAYRRRKQVA